LTVLGEVRSQRLVEVAAQGPHSSVLKILEADTEGFSTIIDWNGRPRSECTVHELVVGTREVRRVDIGPGEVLSLTYKDVMIFGRAWGGQDQGVSSQLEELSNSSNPISWTCRIIICKRSETSIDVAKNNVGEGGRRRGRDRSRNTRKKGVGREGRREI
jgi:hypothetical protein